jgi:hypothetical protein
VSTHEYYREILRVIIKKAGSDKNFLPLGKYDGSIWTFNWADGGIHAHL